MDSIARALAVYLFLLVIFRISGRRTLAQITTFDFILTLIISEAVQQALIDTDNSMTNAFLLVLTLVGTDILLSHLTLRSRKLQKLVDGVPVLVIENGKVHRDRMQKERIEDDDVLSAARSLQGLARLDEIAYAVVERSGVITIVPKRQKQGT
jgi:uncharacterized membrane protein YcaP (DUF421 family)